MEYLAALAYLWIAHLGKIVWLMPRGVRSRRRCKGWRL